MSAGKPQREEGTIKLAWDVIAYQPRLLLMLNWLGISAGKLGELAACGHTTAGPDEQ